MKNSSVLKQTIDALKSHLAGKPHPVPEVNRLAWGWFIDLNRTRTMGMNGPNPISFAEIEAYCRLYRWPLEPRHIEMILAMDRAYLDHAQTQLNNRTPGVKTVPQSSGHAVNPAAFDAVFG